MRCSGAFKLGQGVEHAWETIFFCDERRVYVKFGMRGQEAGSHLGRIFYFVIS